MITLLLILLLLSQPAVSQIYSDEALYKGYLTDDMKLWKEYIISADWDRMGNKERVRLLNYEYGYIAYALSAKDPDVKQLLANFNKHLNSMDGKMEEATRLTYLSAAASYAISLNKFTIANNAPKTFNYADEALTTDPDNPLTLTLRGSIYFYCPKSFGGDKKMALRYLEKAEQLFQQKGDTINNWNYLSTQMITVQCLDKIGNKQEAIRKCRDILQREPDYAYIRDCYLPELLGNKPRRKSAGGNVAASIVSGLE